MKKMVYFICMAFLVSALPLSNAVDFEITLNDAEGDTGNPDVDITKIWTTVEIDKIAFHIKVAGEISTECQYHVRASDGKNSIGVMYTQGVAYFASGTSSGGCETEVYGDTLVMKIPYNTVSSWGSFELSGYSVDGEGNTDFAFSSNEGENNDVKNPGDEFPTDKSIDVEITNVEYSIEKTDGGQKWHAQVIVEGTTSGVDHVSLAFVTYYKNGSYDVSEWLNGPLEIPAGNFMGNEIIKFSFNSTEGNWKKWELEMEVKYPVTEPDYKWVEKEKEVDKFVIYARAFKDKEETQWNQAYYETNPSFTSNGAMYNMEEDGGAGEKSGKEKTPGFGMIAIILAFSVIAIFSKRK